MQQAQMVLSYAGFPKVIEATHPLGMVMKDKVKQYKDRFAEMKIKSAS